MTRGCVCVSFYPAAHSVCLLVAKGGITCLVDGGCVCVRKWRREYVVADTHDCERVCVFLCVNE